VWFEVSGHTNRLHYHLAPDGSKPLGLNLPLEWLSLPEEQGNLQQLVHAWEAAWQQQQQQKEQQQPQLSLPSSQIYTLAQEQQQQQHHEAGGTVQANGIMHGCSQPAQCPQQQLPEQVQQASGGAHHQHCLMSPVLQQTPCTEVPSASQQQQQQQQQSQPQASQPLASALHTGSARGEARSALACLNLPFLSPASAAAATTAPRNAAGDVAGQHLCGRGSSSQQPVVLSQQQDMPGGAGGAVCTSPALIARLRRHLDQQSEQLQLQQPPEQQRQQPQEQQQQQQQQQQPKQQQQHCEVMVIPDSEDEDGAEPAAAAAAEQEEPQLQLLLCSQEQQLQPDEQPEQQQQQVVASSQQLPTAAVSEATTADAPPAAAAGVAAAAAALPDCRLAAGFLGPCGLACVALPLSRGQLLELLRAGAAFAADWGELRSVTRNRLAGKVCVWDSSCCRRRGGSALYLV
jgi:hypothetical protein